MFTIRLGRHHEITETFNDFNEVAAVVRTVVLFNMDLGEDGWPEPEVIGDLSEPQKRRLIAIWNGGM